MYMDACHLSASNISITCIYDWLIDYLFFTSCSRMFHLHGDVTNAGEGLQNLGLCSALRAFEHWGTFIVPHLLWHVASVFPVSSEGPPHSVASYGTQGGVENLFLTLTFMHNISIYTCTYRYHDILTKLLKVLIVCSVVQFWGGPTLFCLLK
jgi:hypothetical protein